MPLHFPGSDVAIFSTLSSLLASPPAGRATALDAPGSMLYEVGGKWGGSLGSVSQTTLNALTAGELAILATGATYRDTSGTQYTYGGAWVGWGVIANPLFATKIGFLGDSITHGASAGNALYAFPQQTVYLCGGRVAIGDSIESGVPGQNTAAMLARLPSLISRGVGVIVLLCGANDAGQSVPVSSWSTSITAIAKKCAASGVKLVQILPIPQTSGSAASAHILLTSYRVWLMQAAQALGITLAHPWQLADPATGYLAASCQSGDAVHPNQLGHQYIAQAAASAVLSVIGSTMGQSLPVAPAGWLKGVVNPLMSGTVMPSGGYEQPGGTGTAPTYVCIADTSGKLLAGKWWQSDIAAAANTARTMAMVASTLAFALGDAVLVHSKIQVDDVSGDWMEKILSNTASAQLALNSGGANKHVIWYACPGLSNGAGMYSYDVYAYIPAATATAYEMWLQCKVPNGSHYRIRWGAPQIYNLTALGINGLPNMPSVGAMPGIP